MSDANSCARELHNLMERYEPDLLIYSLTMRLGELLADQAKDQDDGAMLVDDTTALLRERVEIHLELREAMATNTPVT